MKKRTIAAGKFKAECLGLVDQVEKTRESLIVTKRGRPVVEVIPVQVLKPRPLLGSVTVHGDIVSSILEDWDAER